MDPGGGIEGENLYALHSPSRIHGDTRIGMGGKNRDGAGGLRSREREISIQTCSVCTEISVASPRYGGTWIHMGMFGMFGIEL